MNMDKFKPDPLEKAVMMESDMEIRLTREDGGQMKMDITTNIPEKLHNIRTNAVVSMLVGAIGIILGEEIGDHTEEQLYRNRKAHKSAKRIRKIVELSILQRIAEKAQEEA